MTAEDVPSLENKTHRAERAELVCVDEHAALLDAEGIAGAPEHMPIGTDIFPDALVAPVAIADEIRGDGDEIAVAGDDAHVRDHAAGAGPWKLAMAIGIEHADDPLADALAVVGDEEQRRAMVALGLIVGRNIIGRILGEQLLPLVEPPFVEQCGLVIKEILDLGARDHARCRHRHCAAPISSFQRRQKMRRWCSSLLSCSPSLPMPPDISDQRASAQLASPCCTSSSASTSSGVAKPPGP